MPSFTCVKGCLHNTGKSFSSWLLLVYTMPTQNFTPERLVQVGVDPSCCNVARFNGIMGRMDDLSVGMKSVLERAAFV